MVVVIVGGKSVDDRLRARTSDFKATKSLSLAQAGKAKSFFEELSDKAPKSPLVLSLRSAASLSLGRLIW